MCCESKHRWDSSRWNDEHKQQEASGEKYTPFPVPQELTQFTKAV